MSIWISNGVDIRKLQLSLPRGTKIYSTMFGVAYFGAQYYNCVNIWQQSLFLQQQQRELETCNNMLV